MSIHGLPLPRAHLMLRLARCHLCAQHGEDPESTSKRPRWRYPTSGSVQENLKTAVFSNDPHLCFSFRHFCNFYSDNRKTLQIVWLEETLRKTLQLLTCQKKRTRTSLWPPASLGASSRGCSLVQFMSFTLRLTSNIYLRQKSQCFHTEAMSLERVTTEKHVFAAPCRCCTPFPTEGSGQGSSPPMEYSYMR